jgi:hypothetical protein
MRDLLNQLAGWQQASSRRDVDITWHCPYSKPMVMKAFAVLSFDMRLRSLSLDFCVQKIAACPLVLSIFTVFRALWCALQITVLERAVPHIRISRGMIQYTAEFCTILLYTVKARPYFTSHIYGL